MPVIFAQTDIVSRGGKAYIPRDSVTANLIRSLLSAYSPSPDKATTRKAIKSNKFINPFETLDIDFLVNSIIGIENINVDEFSHYGDNATIAAVADWALSNFSDENYSIRNQALLLYLSVVNYIDDSEAFTYNSKLISMQLDHIKSNSEYLFDPLLLLFLKIHYCNSLLDQSLVDFDIREELIRTSKLSIEKNISAFDTLEDSYSNIALLKKIYSDNFKIIQLKYFNFLESSKKPCLTKKMQVDSKNESISTETAELSDIKDNKPAHHLKATS